MATHTSESKAYDFFGNLWSQADFSLETAYTLMHIIELPEWLED